MRLRILDELGAVKLADVGRVDLQDLATRAGAGTNPNNNHDLQRSDY